MICALASYIVNRKGTQPVKNRKFHNVLIRKCSTNCFSILLKAFS